MIGLTQGQRAVMDFILAYRAQNDGVSPSYRAIQRGMGFKGISSVSVYLSALIERGYLVKGCARAGKHAHVVPTVTADSLRFVLVRQVDRRLGTPTAYRGPYPIRSGVTCGDFDSAGVMKPAPKAAVA